MSKLFPGGDCNCNGCATKAAVRRRKAYARAPQLRCARCEARDAAIAARVLGGAHRLSKWLSYAACGLWVAMALVIATPGASLWWAITAGVLALLLFAAAGCLWWWWARRAP